MAVFHSPLISCEAAECLVKRHQERGDQVSWWVRNPDDADPETRVAGPTDLGHYFVTRWDHSLPVRGLIDGLVDGSVEPEAVFGG